MLPAMLPALPRPALPADDVHVWLEWLAPEQDATRELHARRLLPDEEWQRCQRFVLPEGRRECLAARCLVRTVLSRYAPVEPAAWGFANGPHGRPEVSHPPSDLRFNLSHAGGVVACGVSVGRDVGIDVEWLGRRIPMAVARSRFAASELGALQALPEAAQRRRFLELWTLKEAYVKARSAGLSLRLDQFAFDQPDAAQPRVRFAEGFDDHAAAWQFDRLRIGPEHLAVVATRVGTGSPVRVVVRTLESPEAVPSSVRPGAP
jgi:4'-phosphopantetheinyl transferase